MPPEKSTTYECRRGLPQQGMRRVISLTINDLNRLSSSDLPCRQLRNAVPGRIRPRACDLPCRQLRNVPLLFRQGIGCDLPCRQLRNGPSGRRVLMRCDLPCRQLRKSTAR